VDRHRNHIFINDLARHSFAVTNAIQPAIERVISSGRYILGPECVSFEREFADFCGADYCVGVANGTDALELVFRAFGIGPGNRVATVGNAGFYTSTALAQVGAEPVFVDVEPVTHLMDLDELDMLARAGRIDAVVITHLFGLMHDVKRARDIAARAAIPFIEDCAQAHGAQRDGQRAGSVGDAGCFSFYPTKNLGALGDGGAIVTSDSDIAMKLVKLRQYGWERKYHIHSTGGRNSRLDEIQAAVLRAKLPFLEEWNARRRAIASRYTEAIANRRVSCPPARENDYVAHLYVIECDDRDTLRTHLAERGIFCDVHYPIPDHLQPVMRRQLPATLPVTERLARECLTLPCFPELTNDEVDWVVDHINGWLG
jgi:dTDP-3-amino-2,3,6-trideoxy-4-keto-D-glucose/dTDP-3-amino-3,4,6-trideoxy-alpha-D-glucose/dTDP-2,6-dideoxy-D-kanosamine transaminase